MQKMVFLNVAWMERYEGLSGSDQKISGGGSYVDKYGYGHEIFNYKKINGKVYGYVQPVGSNNLKRLGGSSGDEYLEDVLVVFTANHKNGGTYIVGWYDNAIFYKDYQKSQIKEREFRNKYIGYHAMANSEDATLLSEDQRLSFPKIPRKIKGGMGQSNVWYADSPNMDDFKRSVLLHINDYEQKKFKRTSQAVYWQPDIEKKKKVEKIAVKEVTEEYKKRGFFVMSLESENVGWDLEAVHKKIKLRIEVKGLSGSIVSVEITPNEFMNMNKYKQNYRLCVVTNCLVDPTIYTFSYSYEKDQWLSEDGDLLVIDQIISARCYI